MAELGKGLMKGGTWVCLQKKGEGWHIGKVEGNCQNRVLEGTGEKGTRTQQVAWNSDRLQNVSNFDTRKKRKGRLRRLKKCIALLDGN